MTEEHQQPDGQRDGFHVFKLKLSDERWFVNDLDVESESSAEEELTRFLKASPTASRNRSPRRLDRQEAEFEGAIFHCSLAAF